MPRVFILDNFDSFTFNLAQAFMKLGAEVRVERAWAPPLQRRRASVGRRTWDEEVKTRTGADVSSYVPRPTSYCEVVRDWRPTHLVLSPGPLRPVDHPANFSVLRSFAGRIPILGVCLGMQAINEWCGGTLRRDTPPLHGKTSEVCYETGSPLFDGLPNPFTVARYHSLVVDRLGSGLRADAWVGERVMAVTHKSLPIHGLQFHPESYLTPEGERILDAFLNL